MPGQHPREVTATMNEQLNIEQEIDRFNRENASVAGEVVTPASNGLELVIRGEGFACRRVSTTWQMMQFAKAQREANIQIPKNLPKDHPRRKQLEEKRNNAGMAMMALLLDTAFILLQPAERDRFRMFMDEVTLSDEGLEPGELENAIGEVIAAAGGESGKAERPTSAPSSTSQTIDYENIPVVSLNKAPAEVVSQGPMSSTN